MPTLPISSASINALYLPKPLRLATGKALLGIAIASILSTTATTVGTADIQRIS